MPRCALSLAPGLGIGFAEVIFINYYRCLVLMLGGIAKAMGGDRLFFFFILKDVLQSEFNNNQHGGQIVGQSRSAELSYSRLLYLSSNRIHGK